MSVRVASTANIASLSNTTTTLDGVTLADGDLVLVKNQTTGTQNGVYVVSTTGAWARSSIMPAGSNAFQVAVSVRVGSLGGGDTYMCTSSPAVVGTDSLTFTQIVGNIPYAFYWSAAANGNPTTGQPINGVISGNASYVSTLDGVQLTPNTGSQLGFINWSVPGFDFTKDFEFEIQLFQGSGADGVSFGVGGSAAFTGTGSANNGLIFDYRTVSSLNNCQFLINGSNVGNAITLLTTYTGVWMTSKIVVRTYGTVRYAIAYSGPSFTISNSVNVTSWTPGGSFIYAQGRTGSTTAVHRCNYAALRYI